MPYQPSHSDVLGAPSPGAGSLHRGQEGSALAIVLISLVALTALATGGFLISNVEYRVSQNHAAGARAFHTADAALHDHLGTVSRGTGGATYTYASGAARVTGTRLLDIGDGNILHRIAVTSSHLPPEGGAASRTLSVVAMSHDGGFKARAALTAGAGVLKNGGAGTIDGDDAALTSQCTPGPQAAVAGVGTGPGLYVQKGGSLVPTGNPPIDESMSGLEHLKALNLNWGGVLGGTVVAPDFVIPVDPWPGFSAMDSGWWPVIYIDQTAYSVGPTQSGRGTLIARGDLTLNGAFVWDGILLVGGTLVSNGNNTVAGTTIAGLNMLLGNSVPPASIANGTKKFLFNSCWVRYAAQQFAGGLVQIPGTWSERM